MSKMQKYNKHLNAHINMVASVSVFVSVFVSVVVFVDKHARLETNTLSQKKKKKKWLKRMTGRTRQLE